MTLPYVLSGCLVFASEKSVEFGRILIPSIQQVKFLMLGNPRSPLHRACQLASRLPIACGVQFPLSKVEVVIGHQSVQLVE